MSTWRESRTTTTPRWRGVAANATPWSKATVIARGVTWPNEVPVIQRPSAEQKLLAARLDSLSAQLGAAYRPANDSGHLFEHCGWLLLRTAVTVIASGDRAFSLAADWSARGYPSVTGDPTGSSDGGGLTSVERAATESDEWDRRRARLLWLRQVLDDHARSIESEIAHTVRVAPNEGRRSTLIDCANPHCPNVMTGLGEDRPKDGRCPRCYQFRYRNRRDWTEHGVDHVTTPNMQVTV